MTWRERLLHALGRITLIELLVILAAIAVVMAFTGIGQMGVSPAP